MKNITRRKLGYASLIAGIIVAVAHIAIGTNLVSVSPILAMCFISFIVGARSPKDTKTAAAKSEKETTSAVSASPAPTATQ
ncbi:Uncharacterised protein [Dermatophilus congolensis]|uniref:Uncharacterized protein n=1 Tax=Dermatophilus congolensis TaxID=1863 RepID=A0AA46BLA9_9MICO|nr:hypothetical protein [Dermatophilus congolensis]STD03659.1 Uncharacterised protein [Dermatophilus congolensis]